MSSRRPRHAPAPRSSWDWTLVTRALNAPTALPYNNAPPSQPPASQQAVQNPQGTTIAELDAATTPQGQQEGRPSWGCAKCT